MKINRNWVFDTVFTRLNGKWGWYVMFSKLGMHIFKLYGRYSFRDEAIAVIEMLQHRTDEELEEIWKEKDKNGIQHWGFLEVNDEFHQ